MPRLTETGPWSPKTPPTKEEESSRELPETQKQSSVALHVLATSPIWEPAAPAMRVLREVQAGKAKRIAPSNGGLT